MLEIEAKFRVEQPSIIANLLQLTALGPYALIPTPGIEYQHNTYFDTPDRLLAAQHSSLRVRGVGRQRFGTFKRSLPTHAGVHTREEWQVELDSGDTPYAWPASAARDQALMALSGAVAVPLFTVRTQRQYMYAVRASVVVAEISLDKGTIYAGERTSDFCEIEIELLEGQLRADLDAIAGHLQARYPIVPESRGKKRRGLALLDAPKTLLPRLRSGLERARAIGSRG